LILVEKNQFVVKKLKEIIGGDDPHCPKIWALTVVFRE
jgi:hypothetical protein